MAHMDVRKKQRLVIAGAAAGILLLSACAQPDAPPPDETTLPGTPPAATGVEGTGEHTPTEDAGADADREGEPSWFGPSAGASLTIVGVEYPRTIALLEEPGDSDSVAAELDPLTTDVTATGNNWQLPGSIWFEVDTDEGTGWVNSRNLTHLGATDDATAQIIESEGRLTAESIEELGSLVAEFYAAEEPPSRIVKSGPAAEGDLHEVTYDVVGLPDDAVMGYRLHVFGVAEEGTVTLRTVERTAMCARGVTEDALCV